MQTFISNSYKNEKGEKKMDEIDWSNLLKDEGTRQKVAALLYFGLALYFGLKKKPSKRELGVKQVETPRKPERPKKPQEIGEEKPLTLSEMVGKMIEEAYGIER